MITTERLILRQWEESDRDDVFRLNSSDQVMEFYPGTLTREESDALFDRDRAYIERHGYGLWAVEDRETGALAGTVGLLHRPDDLPFSPCTEIGWRLMPEFWGRGLAHEAAWESFRYGFRTLALQEIVAFTAVINERSWRLMERLHMKKDTGFDHPKLPTGDPLEPHILYRLTREEFDAYDTVLRSGYQLPMGHVPLGRYGNGQEMSNALLRLVRSGDKRATTGLVWEYEAFGEELPFVGQMELVTDFDGRPELLTRDVAVHLMTFREMTEELAAREGEGDRSLEYWRRAHWRFFDPICANLGKTVSEDMPLVFTEFEVVQDFAD